MGDGGVLEVPPIVAHFTRRTEAGAGSWSEHAPANSSFHADVAGLLIGTGSDGTFSRLPRAGAWLTLQIWFWFRSQARKLNASER